MDPLEALILTIEPHYNAFRKNRPTKTPFRFIQSTKIQMYKFSWILKNQYQRYLYYPVCATLLHFGNRAFIMVLFRLINSSSFLSLFLKFSALSENILFMIFIFLYLYYFGRYEKWRLLWGVSNFEKAINGQSLTCMSHFLYPIAV